MFFERIVYSGVTGRRQDGQSHLVIKSLSNLWLIGVKEDFKSWEACLPHVEFAYHHSAHRATKLSPFYIVYGFSPLTLLDLLPLLINEQTNHDGQTKAEYIVSLHKQVKKNI